MCEHKNKTDEQSGWFHSWYGIWMGSQIVEVCADCGKIVGWKECTIGEVHVSGIPSFRKIPDNWSQIEYVADMYLKRDKKKAITLMKPMTTDMAWICWLLGKEISLRELAEELYESKNT